jgi:hypothetical protein
MTNRRRKERRNGDRRTEEDTGVWRIFDDIWNGVALRRHTMSRRSD